MLAGVDRRTEIKRRKIRMTTYQETNAGARTSEEDMRCGTPPRPILRAVDAEESPAVMMAVWMLSSRLPESQELAPIRSSCLPLVGRPVSLVRWGLWLKR